MEIDHQRRETARNARRRLVAHLRAGGATDLAESCMAQDATVYTDPVRHERERVAIFGQWPLVAGLSQDLPRPGDILVFEEMGRSILLVRDNDGVARGYLNMCAHRGARLVETQQHGLRLHRSRIVCPFHAWCYDLDGSLVAAPGADGFGASTLASRKLHQVAVQEWNGLLLVTSDGQPAAHERFASIAGPVAELRLKNLRHVQTSTVEAACNWKLAVDTYAENYHFGALHGASIGDAYISNVAAFDAFAPHWRVFFPERSLEALVGLSEQDWPEPAFKSVMFLFPNTVLVAGVVGQTGMMLRIYRIFPGRDVGSSVCRMSVYTDADPASLHESVFVDESTSVVTVEDYRVAEGAQANLAAAPTGATVLYGRNEPGVQAFHAAIADALGEPGPVQLPD
ncbi:MAG: aromatic ring-hydroxylating dioxygenase subunit alpha [Alphaproteobacteria bacterium]|nr:MAG: aromatic ring-hydroxylating dioxygenase subunit alpha [Alphaproteobacteria bacterium]